MHLLQPFIHKLIQLLSQRDAHAHVWRLAFPIMLSNVTVPLLGIVDTAVVGHLPEAHHIGAVAVGAMIFGIVYWGFGFLRMGTTGLTAQANGADDADEMRAVLGRALALALLFSGALLLLQTPIAQLSFYLVDADVRVAEEGQVYFFIRILSAPASLANYVILGWFLGMQNARIPLMLLVLINTINIVLDVYFVTYLGMAADGVAWASVIAEYMGMVAGLQVLAHELKRNPGKWRIELLINKQKLLALLSLNKDIFIRTLCLMFTLAFFTTQGARYGELILAANAVLFQMHTFMAYGLDGFSHAVEALVGRAVGRRDEQSMLEYIVTASFWALLMSLTFALVILGVGNKLVAMITDIGVVRLVAQEFIPWVALLPLVAVTGFLFDGIFLGATRAREMRNTMLFSTFLIFLPLWYGLRFLGNHGLWLAFIAFMVARGLSMSWVFFELKRSGQLLRGY